MEIHPIRNFFFVFSKYLANIIYWVNPAVTELGPNKGPPAQCHLSQLRETEFSSEAKEKFYILIKECQGSGSHG